jgi:hypothetical protein
MKFETGRKNEEKLNAWLQTHVLDCEYWQFDDMGRLPQGASGGAITYTFTPTTLGLVIKVQCACGDEHDVTDYDEW